MDFSPSTRSLLKVALLSMSILQAHGHVMSSPDPTITAAPNLHAQILKRQDGGVTCTEWSFLGGGGPPVCSPGFSCYLDYYGSYAGCQAETAPAVGFLTSCIDYGDSWDGVGDTASIGFCSGTAPYCVTEYFVDDLDNIYYNYGCDTSFYVDTVTQVGPVAYATAIATAVYSSTYIYTSTTAAPSFTPIIAPSPTSPSPIVVAPSTTPTTSASSSSSGGGSKAAIIGGAVGGGVGGIAVIACCIFIFFCLRKRRQQKSPAPATYEPGIQGSMQSPIQAPQESSYKPPFSSVTEKSGKYTTSSAC